MQLLPPIFNLPLRGRLSRVKNKSFAADISSNSARESRRLILGQWGMLLLQPLSPGGLEATS
jgi:hypothetical protein